MSSMGKMVQGGQGSFLLNYLAKEQCDAMGIKIDAPVIGKGE